MKQFAHNETTGSSVLAAANRTGVVIDCNPATYTATVFLDASETLTDVPFFGMYGAAHDDDITWTKNWRGAKVYLQFVENEYYIVNTMPVRGEARSRRIGSGVGVSGTGGDEKATYGALNDQDYSANRSVDFLPGDKVLRAEANTELGLFRGGWARLKVSPLCQLVMCKFKDLTRLISRTFEFHSDFGTVEVTHLASGRVGLHIAGGADFATESTPAAPSYTVQCWMGDHPGAANDRFFLEVLSGGASVCTMAFDTAGNITTNATGNIVETVAGTKTTTVTGNITLASDAVITIQAPLVQVNP